MLIMNILLKKKGNLLWIKWAVDRLRIRKECGLFIRRSRSAVCVTDWNLTFSEAPLAKDQGPEEDDNNEHVWEKKQVRWWEELEWWKQEEEEEEEDEEEEEEDEDEDDEEDTESEEEEDEEGEIWGMAKCTRNVFVDFLFSFFLSQLELD